MLSSILYSLFKESERKGLRKNNSFIVIFMNSFYIPYVITNSINNLQSLMYCWELCLIRIIKLIMIEEYSQQNEDKFVEELKRSKTKVNTLRSLQNSLSKSQSQHSLGKAPKEAQHIMKQRFGSHIKLLKRQINNVEEHCEKFGGKQFIKNELDRNEITKDEYAQYCAARISSNFQLPKVENRSQSFKELRSKVKTDRNSKIRYNKWFINPEDRFAKSKERTQYDWNKPSFILNIVRERGNVLDHKYLPKFIDHVKESLHREPLLCRYTAIKQKK